MKKVLSQLWSDDAGVLSFEWIALNSVVAIGVVAGMASVRDALNDEMADLTEAITSLDQSYAIPGPLVCTVHAPDNSPGFNGQRGNSNVNTSVRVGEGYSQSQWKTFTERYKDSGEILANYGGGGGATGSVYRDRKPTIDRERLEQGPLPAIDESSMIDGSEAPPAMNKQ